MCVQLFGQAFVLCAWLFVCSSAVWLTVAVCFYMSLFVWLCLFVRSFAGVSVRVSDYFCVLLLMVAVGGGEGVGVTVVVDVGIVASVVRVLFCLLCVCLLYLLCLVAWLLGWLLVCAVLCLFG